MGLFDKRLNYKPFEYPEILQFTEAMNKTFWVHSEVDFTADIQDFHTQLTPAEQSAIKRALLAIAQIEVAVKSFWGNLYRHFPKPEMNGLGSTFAECEFRHSEAYSRLLEVLGYDDEFEALIQVPAIRKRIDYLNRALAHTASQDRREYSESLVLFTILIENVSLFSQFAIILAFPRFKSWMKNVANIISWTSIDEQVHANAGIYLINQLKKEYPETFDEGIQQHIIQMVKESIEIEGRMIDWIFEEGSLDIIKKEDLYNFIKYRVDDSLKRIGIQPIYRITSEQYHPMKWFEEDVFANSLDDFFAKRPTEYTKHDKSIGADDLF